jgi:hypothetical protein
MKDNRSTREGQEFVEFVEEFAGSLPKYESS